MKKIYAIIAGLFLSASCASAEVTITDLPVRTADGSENIMIFDVNTAYRTTVDEVASPNAVSGPAANTSTDDAIVLWDGVLGRLVSDSTLTVPEAGSLNLPLSLYVGGVEFLQYDADAETISIGEGTLDPATMANGTQSIFIGERSGLSQGLTDGGEQTCIGYQSCGSAASPNTWIGWDNIGIGRNTLKNATGDLNDNVAVGYRTGEKLAGASDDNILIGSSVFSGAAATQPYSDNVIIGTGAGGNLQDGVDGSNGNVIIGRSAGPATPGETDDSLWINNSTSDTPLIHGDFATPAVTINGALETTGLFTPSGGVVALPYVDFALDLADPSFQEGRISWNNDDGTLNFMTDNPNVTIQAGQEFLIRVQNDELDSLTDGEVVYITGASGGDGVPTVERADSSTHTSVKALGLVTGTITSGGKGFVTAMGKVRGLDTNHAAPEDWVNGDILYVDDVAGALTKTQPVWPEHQVPVAIVTRVDDNAGVLFAIWPSHGTELGEIHDVGLTTPVADDVLAYDGSKWINHSPAYGSMYVDRASPTSIADLGTGGTDWNKVPWGSNGSKITSNVTADSTTDEDLQLNAAGDYDVKFFMSFSGSLSTTFTCAVFKNAAVFEEIVFIRKIGTGGDVGSASAGGIVTSDGDDIFDVRCMSASGENNKTMTIQAGNFSAEHIQ